jgi:hypothetical protein
MSNGNLDRPACPRCGGIDFHQVDVAAGGLAHICDTCQWPRPDTRDRNARPPGEALSALPGKDDG